MKQNTMSLRAKINNYAKSCHIRPQAVLQTIMFERFLERLSRSPYQRHFVLKGGTGTWGCCGHAMWQQGAETGKIFGNLESWILDLRF